MDAEVLHPDAAASEEHIEWNKELKQSYQHPNWDDIGWPEEEKGVQHVKCANNSNYTPTYIRLPLDIEQFVQSFLLFFFPNSTDSKVEDTVEEDHNENEDIAIELGLVDSDYEAESFHKE